MDFAKVTVVTVEVVIRESDRGFGGRRMRQDEGDCNHDDVQPGAGMSSRKHILKVPKRLYCLDI